METTKDTKSSIQRTMEKKGLLITSLGSYRAAIISFFYFYIFSRFISSAIISYFQPICWQKIKNPNYKGKWKTPWIDNPGMFKFTSSS